ncbi:MAG: dicarboxylate/amino acid:cation symporter [Candidatus Delongbacteria bacterium]|nr:dicarboxylate/amino acid:cation symporter [Candidatus Delongbacteria bacterium]MBN2835708.1 dicarboxylate/amino acid:cation symporter [Candidatus Delongbacteria bacterium]
MSKDKKLSLNSKIVIALIAGLLVGMVVGDTRVSTFMKDFIVFGVFNVIGQLFLNMLSMIVLPVVLVSLVSGIAGLGNIKRMSRLGGLTILYFFGTTFIAIFLGISITYLFNPGGDFHLTGEIMKNEKLPSFAQAIIDFIPTNPFNALQSGTMLQMIFFTALVGISISILGKKVQNTISIIQQLNKLVLKMINMIMAMAPIGVFALVINVFAKEGFDAFIPMLKYMGTLVFVLIVHTIITYGSVLKMLNLNRKIFIRKFRSVFLTGFSTSSSNATLPIAMSMVQYKCGVFHKITSSVVPLGVTINKNGTVIMQSVATIFIAQAYGVELGLGSILTAALFMIVASVSTAGIPNAGMITITVVLASIGLPAEGLVMIIAVDRLLDMLRTTVNLAGNTIAAVFVAKKDGKLDETVYNDPRSALGEEKTIGEFGQEISINKEYLVRLQNEKMESLLE